jgi:transposase-like protein
MARVFSKEFKEDAVNYAKANKSNGVRGNAAILGIGYSTLDKWLREAREQEQSDLTIEDLRAENIKLKKKNAELEEVADILKKATRYFAGQSK